MPLCPQITNTPITVTQTSDFTVSSVSPVVPATTADVAVAQAAADSAQSTANSASSTATNAYNKAVTAVQTSSNTIVNASNQLTAINGNGITVYAGASSTSGARVILNSAGITGFNTGGTATFAVDASNGSVSMTGSLITGGSITGSSIDINSGTFQVTSAGALTASSATITGTINANSGYLGSSSNGWNFSSSGYLTNSGGSTILYPTTTPGGNATTYSVYTDRGVYAERLYITGSQSSAVYSSGGVYAMGTLAGANAAFLVNSSGSITAVVNITQTGTLTGNTGITSSGAITTSGNISTSGSGTITAAGTLSGASITTSGNLTVNAYIYNPGYPSTTGAANMRINTSSGLIAYTSSSARYKVAIEEQAIPVNSIFSLTPKSYVDKTESEEKGTIDGLQRWIGLIAEDVAQIPVLKDYLVEYNAEGEPNSVYYDRVGVALIPALKDLNNRLLALEGK